MPYKIKTHRKYDAKSEPYYKPWIYLTIMCQYWFINCNKCTTLMQDVNNGKT